MISQNTFLSVVPGTVPPVIHVSQYDTGLRTLSFTITDSSLDFTGTSLRLDGRKPDGNAFSYSNGADFSIIRSGNVVTCDCVQQMTAVAGSVKCAILFISGNNRLESAEFILEVKQAAIPDDSVISDTDLPAIIGVAREQEEAAAASAASAAISEENAEAWAVGKRGGVDVPSSDETYHNNAKYFAEEAGDSAADAATSETNAGLSETAAAGSAEDAEAWAVGKRSGIDVGSSDDTYHNNSKYYADNAGSSASDAAASETAAEGSAEDAEAWAIGKRNGTDVPTTDDTYNNNSKYYAANAATSAAQADDDLDEINEKVQNISSIIDNAILLNVPQVTVDLSTGHLMWQGGKFELQTNDTTGQLQWRVS